MDDNAHEVGLGGSDSADSLGIGEVSLVLQREYWRQGGIFHEGMLGSEETLVQLGFSRDIVGVLLLLMLLGCGYGEVAKGGDVADEAADRGGSVEEERD